MAAETVTIGGDDFVVSRFKTYKAVLVGEVLAKVTTEVRGLFKEAAAFQKEWRAENSLQITRSMCLDRVAELDAAAARARKDAEDAPAERVEPVEANEEEDIEEVEGQLSRDDLLMQADLLEGRSQSWKAQLEDMGDAQAIEVPQDPDENMVAMAVFPKAFEMRRELAELLALLTTPDSDLRAEWRKDSVHDMLRARGEDLLEKSEPAEIIELAMVAKRVVGDQMRPLVPALRKIWESWNSPETVEGQAKETATTNPEETSTPTNDSPTLSTPSPAPTDGASSPSGSTSPGALPSPSPVG